MKNNQYNHYSTLKDASTNVLEKEQIQYLAMLFDGHFDDFETDVWEDMDTLEEVFQSMNEDGEEEYQTLDLKGPFHVLFMGYDGTKPYLKQHLQFEENEEVTLLTNEPKTPFKNCENMLLTIKDQTGAIKEKYYLENEFEEIGDWYKKEAFEEVKQLTGLNPDDEHIYVVSVSS